VEIDFFKLQSCGCDYLIINTLKTLLPPQEDLSELAAQILSRRFGVGAMAMILILPGKGGRLMVRCFMADGEESAPSPLALRCAGRLVFDSGLAEGEDFRLETINGPQPIQMLDSRNMILTLGPPQDWEGDRVSSSSLPSAFLRTVRVEQKTVNVTTVTVGEPHAVTFLPDFSAEAGEYCRSLAAELDCGADTCLDLARIISGEQLSVRTWDLAGQEKLASETSACAALAAAALNGLAEREAVVHLGGGNLLVQWQAEDNRFQVTGPADYVFTGSFYYDEEKNPLD